METTHSPSAKTGFIAKHPNWVATAFAIVYGLITRFIFGARITDSFLSTLSVGFLVGMPFALGAAAVFISWKGQGETRRGAMSTSLVAGFILLCGVLLFNIEVFICILMAAPLFLVVTLIGGLVMNWIIKIAERRGQNRNTVSSLLIILLIAPYFITPIETRFAPQDSIRTVDTHITIQGKAEVVWEHIVRVPYIGEDEQRFTWFHLIGIPRPLEATLSYDGVGGVRDATFESGLTFKETITHWEPLKTTSFKIELNNPGDPSQPFNQIGGKYFEVLDATYTIEPLPDGQIVLHLSSRHRLSTTFNTYGGLWTDFIMRDIQDYILGIIKQRVEAEQ